MNGSSAWVGLAPSRGLLLAGLVGLGGCATVTAAPAVLGYRCDDIDLVARAPGALVTAPAGDVVAVVATRVTPWGRFDDSPHAPVVETADAAERHVGRAVRQDWIRCGARRAAPRAV